MNRRKLIKEVRDAVWDLHCSVTDPVAIRKLTNDELECILTATNDELEFILTAMKESGNG